MNRLISAMSIGLAAILAQSAAASYHTFKISEVYSSPNGLVQFIELHETLGADFQNLVTLAPDIKSTTHDFVFPTNLPNTSTANKSFILGTAGYNSIAGAPPANYIIPANFFNPAGDTLQYGTTGGIADLTTFGAMPANVLQSLNRVGTSGNTFTAAANSPTNFAGTTGSVPEPATPLLLAFAAVGSFSRPLRISQLKSGKAAGTLGYKATDAEITDCYKKP